MNLVLRKKYILTNINHLRSLRKKNFYPSHNFRLITCNFYATPNKDTNMSHGLFDGQVQTQTTLKIILPKLIPLLGTCKTQPNVQWKVLTLEECYAS